MKRSFLNILKKFFNLSIYFLYIYVFEAIPNFHKRHPLACYLSSMLLCFGGGMLCHFLLGEPVLDDFKTHQSLALASACWYLFVFNFKYQNLCIKLKN
jgi:hypothetical protein